MLQLKDSELFGKLPVAFKNQVNELITNKLQQNMGVILPKHIEPTLVDLKTFIKKKSASALLVLDGIKLYEF